MHNNQFCLTSKSQGVSFNQAIPKLKQNFKVVDSYLTEENVNSHFIYGSIPQKIESHLVNFIVYDLETHNSDRARPYCISFYRLSKSAGSFNRDLSQYELKKCKIDTFVFDDDYFIIKALDFL